MTHRNVLNVSMPNRSDAAETPVAPVPLHRSRAKRLFDIVGGLGLLVLFGPVMLLIAGLTRLDGGKAIFGHRRVGAGGQPFTCLKFRSMVTNAEEVLQDLLARDPNARAEWDRDFKLRNDPRVTRLGAFLRKSSLDELPQIFNVLRGEMSIVGPRPIVTAEVPRYEELFGYYAVCRPGLTGLWQVSGRSDVDYRRRVELDAAYVRDWSFSTDILIIIKTAWVVVRGLGAY